ncbi:MAG: pilus assembly protein PilC, partial [Acidobacteria bacterium]
MGQIGMSFRVGQAAGAALPSGRQASDGARAAAKRGAGRGAEKSREAAAPKSRARVKPKDLAIFTRQLSVMIDAGLPLVQSLEILGAQQENKAFARMLIGVRSSVEGGSTLANALRQYPRPFDDLYTNMVEAGETGGILDTILKRLSTYIEKAVKLRRAVQSAMIYPAAVLT